MDASRRTSRQNLRPLGAALVLLLALVAFAPDANALGAHHAKAHAVAATVRFADTQSATSAGADQPALAAACVPSAAARLIAGSTADSSTTADPSTVDSTRTRGPPDDAH